MNKFYFLMQKIIMYKKVMKSVKNKTLSNVSWTRVPIVPSYYIKNNNSYHTNQFSYRTATLILILKFIVNSKKKN